VTRRTLFACLVAAAVTPFAFAENWPQWRGPKNDGHGSETGLPTQWGPDKNVVWKLKLPGRGASTPCVWEDKIFLTAQDESTVHLICVGTDGKEKWRKPLGTTFGFPYPQGHADNATASCSTDGKHVWGFAGSGRLACYTTDGAEVWALDLKQKYGNFHASRATLQFGPHWTPALYKGRLYCQVMFRGVQKLLCVDAANGNVVWAVDRKGYDTGESPHVYASPLIWEGQGGPLLIAHGNDYCTGHKLDDGAEVWRVQGLNPTNNGAWRFVSSPLVTPDLIVVPSCKNGPTVGLNPVGAKGDIQPGNPAELWRLTSSQVTTPDVPSPLRVGEIVYLVGAGGGITAVDAKTGATHYRNQPTTPGLHRASPVFADGRVYVVGVDGGTAVVKPGPKYELLAKNTLPDKFLGSPAVSGGRIYLHGYDSLWAIGTK
jgi:hypothetical protein